VEHDAIIGRVGAVAVRDPVARPQVHLDIADVQAPRAVDQHGALEIRPARAGAPSGVDHLQRFARRGQQRLAG